MTEEQERPLAMVVDDDPTTRRLMRRALERFKCCREVLEVGDGLAAQVFLREHPDIDLVLTDIRMPGLDGLELLRWGREQAPGIAWIILSGLDTFDTAVEAIRLGAFDFLTKPLRMEELEISVRNALERRRLLQARERLATGLAEANEQLLSQVEELREKSALLQRDLERAEVIQRALLPSAPPPIERYCVHTVYRPGQHVGGDLYDVVRLQDRYLSFYVADATGHGVTAAMLSVLYKQRLKLVDGDSGEPLRPAQVLDTANQALCDAVATPGLFVTAVYCLLDMVEGTVTLASAGHSPVVHVRSGGEARMIRRTGPALGLSPDARFGEDCFRLEPSDWLLLYTDGLLHSGTAPELEDLRNLLSRRCGRAELLADLLRRARRSGADEEAEEWDDITLLLLDARTGQSTFDNGAGTDGSAQRGATARPAGVVFCGEDETASYLAVRGRATWLHCNAFYETAKGFVEMRRPLVIDLSACDYLDSTFLGTIHDLVGRGEVQIHGVKLAVRELFEELDMERVLANVREAGALPQVYPLAGPGDTAMDRMRILRAHETLAALSTRNNARFRAVVEGMRRDLEGG